MFEDWSDDGRPVVPVDLNRSGALGVLQDSYGLPGDQVLSEVLGLAFRSGAQRAVLERRYIDADYRNEHSEFYSRSFRRYPSVAHRLHFFSEQFAAPTERPKPFIFRNKGYLGYTVLRPIPAAPVGRTVLQIPTELTQPDSIICAIKDSVNVFGSDLTVKGTPFYAQDAQLSRCGQVSALMAAYYHHRLNGSPRILPNDISKAVADHAGELGRNLPSPGLNIAQIADAAAAIGLPAVTYPIERLYAKADFEATACRYLNSRLPIIVATSGHAFLLVGYRRVFNEIDGRHEIHFLRHDDEVGPYQWVHSWRLDERYGPWLHLVVPLPAKVYLHGKEAENIGSTKIRDVLEASSDQADQAILSQLNDIDKRPVSWRSAVIPSNEFKLSVEKRLLPDNIGAAYQFLSFSKYVWVVELTDRRARDEHRPCVLAEAVIDATDHHRDARPLAWRVPSGLGFHLLDVDRAVFDDGLRTSQATWSMIDTYVPYE